MHWRELLLLFGVLWGAQVLGTALQMRHVRRTLAGLAASWSDGFVGAGNGRARFGRGAIVILAVDPENRVRRALVMEGRTVWAKFRDMALPPGSDLAALRHDPAAVVAARPSLAAAFRSAAEQIELARARRAGEGAPVPAR